MKKCINNERKVACSRTKEQSNTSKSGIFKQMQEIKGEVLYSELLQFWIDNTWEMLIK